MTDPRRSRAYRLLPDLSRLNSDLGGEEARPLDAPEITAPIQLPSGTHEVTWPLSAWLLEPVPFPVQEPVPFAGFLPGLDGVAFPVTLGHWPLLSHRALDALASTGPFPHRSIEVRLYDDTDLDAGFQLRRERFTDEYTLLHLTSHLDALDLERSRYRRLDPASGIVEGLRHTVLRVPSGGFPPVFRLTVLPGGLFLSGEGRAALEALGVTGVLYEDVDCASGLPA